MASLIVAGSTGAIGRTVVQHAAKRKDISRIVALTRSQHISRDNYGTLFGVYPYPPDENGDTPGAALSATEERKTGSLAKNEMRLTEEEMNKIVPITFDWDFFLDNWTLMRRSFRFSGVVQQKRETADDDKSNEEEAAENARLRTVASANAKKNEAPPQQAADDLFAAPGTARVGIPMHEQLHRWHAIFANHTFAAMCLGTTRADAGSADAFMRCDYDYVIAFTEAVLHFSSVAGIPFDGRPRPAKGFVNKDHPIAMNDFFLYKLGSKCTAAKVTTKAASGDGTIDFLEALPRFTTIEPADAIPATCPAADEGADGAGKTREATTTTTTTTTAAVPRSGTLRRFCQVSAYNASKDSFILYAKTKGAADAAVAERVLYTNELAAQRGQAGESGEGLVELSYIMPGMLERYDKTRGKEKLGKWLLSAIGVERCGACVVANLVYPDHHLRNDPAQKTYTDEDAYLVGAEAKKRNKHAFDVGKYYQPAAEKHQVELRGNRLLYYWQGNAEIERQAARLEKA